MSSLCVRVRHFDSFLLCMTVTDIGKVKETEVAQSCLTLCVPMDCSQSGSSVHGIFQAIVLEWTVISFSRGFSRPRDRTRVSCIVDRRFTVWANREVPLKYSFREGLAALPRPMPFLTKFCLVKAMVFPVVIYGRVSWIVKKAECQRIDAFF